MANLNNFDANQVEPEVTRQPLPSGDYLAALIESEMKPTSNGKGKFLKLTFQVVDGDHKDRKIFDNLVLEHPNQETVRIARARLSAICRVIGVMAPKDSVELHNVPLVVKVGMKKRDDNGELANKVTGYAKKGAAAPAPESAGAVAGGKTPPWKR